MTKVNCKGCGKSITTAEGYLCQECPCWVCYGCAVGILDYRSCISHYCAIKLKLKGDIEPILRALCEVRTNLGKHKKWSREMIQVHADPVNLHGYRGDKRQQKANIVIPRNFVGDSSNDLGLEQRKDGTWTLHVSEFDKNFYGDTWQKKFMSEWAVQSVGWEAEQRGHQWTVDRGTEEVDGRHKEYAYVRVVQPSW